jgi:peptidoglycan/LPS O-acetylase OafA/YrhL
MDFAKGIAVLWVVYFHFFINYLDPAPTPTSGHFINDVFDGFGPVDSFASKISVWLKIGWLALSQLGFHAVGMFLVLGGWALGASTCKKAEREPIEWRTWYFQRFTRLYPMYWVGHLALLLLPFTWIEHVDHHFLVSLTGIRFLRVQEDFYYGNASWWYFGMLVQFYFIFPVLFWLLRRLGRVGFLLSAFAVGFGLRYLLLEVWHSHGYWVQGANCLSRLPEFALGMVAGVSHMSAPEKVEKWLLRWPALCTGLFMYAWIPRLYAGSAYIFADVYSAIACTLCVASVVGFLQRSEFLAKWIPLVGSYSFGIFLLHQPLVTWFGLKLTELSILQFVAVAIPTLIVIASLGISVESKVNAIVERLLGSAKAQ